MIQFEERAYFPDGWEKTTNQERVHQFLEAPWGFSLTWKQRPVPTGHRIRGELWEYESSAIKSSWWFWNPRYFQGNVLFLYHTIYTYRYIMIYYLIEMYTYIYIYTFEIDISLYTHNICLPCHVMIPFLYSCPQQNCVTSCTSIDDSIHTSLFDRFHSKLSKLDMFCSGPCFGVDGVWFGWHPLVECTHIRSVCFIVLLLVYSMKN